MDTDCIFCKIVAGELPCAKIYEDDDVLAFLDIGPIVKGHTLVIPKAHTETVRNTPADTLAKIMPVAKRIAEAQYAGFGADGVNITQANGTCAGQVVPHIHFHVIPRFNDDGHHWNWRQLSYEGRDEMAEYAGRITDAMV